MLRRETYDSHSYKNLVLPVTYCCLLFTAVCKVTVVGGYLPVVLIIVSSGLVWMNRLQKTYIEEENKQKRCRNARLVQASTVTPPPPTGASIAWTAKQAIIKKMAMSIDQVVESSSLSPLRSGARLFSWLMRRTIPQTAAEKVTWLLTLSMPYFCQ